MLLEIYPYIQSFVYSLLLIFLALMLVRLAFNYADPNPFGAVGRFSYKLKKQTDTFVYPAARFLANFRIDTKLAPLLTSIIAGVLVHFFALPIVYNTFKVIDGLVKGINEENPTAIIGSILYGLLSLLVLFIFLRFLSSWFVFTRNTFFGFVKKVTDPIMLPVQKLIPPIGMFDISAMIVLIVISVLQSVVLRTFVF